MQQVKRVLPREKRRARKRGRVGMVIIMAIRDFGEQEVEDDNGFLL